MTKVVGESIYHLEDKTWYTFIEKGSKIRDVRHIGGVYSEDVDRFIEKLQQEREGLEDARVDIEEDPYGGSPYITVSGWRASTPTEQDIYHRETQRRKEYEQRQIDEAETLLRKKKPEIFTDD